MDDRANRGTVIPEIEQESIPYEHVSLDIDRRRNANISLQIEQMDITTPEESEIIKKSTYSLEVVSKKDLASS